MSSWVCAACGGENPEGMRFCGHCGAKATEAEPKPTHADVSEALRSFVAGPVADRLVEAGGHLPEERRLITALFADVSGFTALADRLDPEQLLEVIDPVISTLSSIVGRYEGYVEKFAGDALLALFGAPVTHEDDAARALLVALEMHEELAQLCDELPQKPDLTLHVGVNSGHGIARILGSEARMDYAVLGDSVILAQRLESAAPSGETYVSEMTVALTRDDFEFEPVGELTLKGKREPVPAWRLVGRRRRAAVSARPLIGRESELATVNRLLNELATGRGGAIRLTGEPGVGKSRLTHEATSLSGERGLRWLQTRCLSYGAALAYWPYIELLRGFAGIHAEEKPEHAAKRLRAAVDRTPESLPYFARLLGLNVEESAEVASLEPEAFRRGMHDAFKVWLSALAAETPTVLALEDLHWVDSSSATLTAELIARCEGEAVSFFLIARPEASDALAEIAPHALAIELARLGDDAVHALVEVVLGAPGPSDLSTFVAARTGGNPLFVEEMVRSLLEAEAVVRRDGGWQMSRDWNARTLPTTIEEVLSARIDLLPRAAATALQIASVIGRRVRLELLQAVNGQLGDVEQSIDELVARGFFERIDEDGKAVVTFHHALVQDAAYGRLLRRRRRELHLRVAEAAEALYGAGDDVIDLLARHLYLGEAGPKAVDYLLRAGDRARRLFANEEAILHFTRAAELAPEDAEVRLQLADLHDLVGQYAQALVLYEEVVASGGDVRAWAGKAAALRRQGDYEGSLAVVATAFSTPDLRGTDLTRLWLESGWTLSLSGRPDEAIDVFQAGIEAAKPRRDAQVGRLIIQLARTESSVGRYEEALEHAFEAEGICDEDGDLPGVATALRVAGAAYSYLDRFDEAANALRRGLELAERVGSAEEIGGCLINLALAEKRRGHLEAAMACERRAIEQFERIGHESGRTQAYTNLADTLERVGELDEALRHCAKAQELARSIGYPLAIADTTNTIATVELKRGNFAVAGAKAEEAAELYMDVGAAPQVREMLDLAADAWERAGEDERARACTARARDVVAT